MRNCFNNGETKDTLIWTRTSFMMRGTALLVPLLLLAAVCEAGTTTSAAVSYTFVSVSVHHRNSPSITVTTFCTKASLTRSRPPTQTLEPEQANVNAPTSAAHVAQKSDGETSLSFRPRSEVRVTHRVRPFSHIFLFAIFLLPRAPRPDLRGNHEIKRRMEHVWVGTSTI